MRQAGGHVEVESELGNGTSVAILLPIAEPRAEHASTDQPGGPSPRGHETILVVEDEEPVRRVLVRALTSVGYRVLCAGSAEEARVLSADQRGPIELLVSDVVLPTADGPTLAAALREERPSLRVLFTSGYVGESVGGRGIAPADLLQKPFSPVTLRERVRRVLDEA